MSGIQVKEQHYRHSSEVDWQLTKQGNQYDGQQSNQCNQEDGQVTSHGNKDDGEQSNQGKQDDKQPSRKEEIDELLKKYNQFLADLKGSPVNFIHTIKKANKTGKIIVNVKKTKAEDVRGKIESLPNFKTYASELEILECAPSKFLMQNDQTNSLYRMPDISNSQLNIRVGSGSLIAVVNDDQIEAILNNKNARTLREVANMCSVSNLKTGTLTCLAKYKNRFYAMTSQHVVDIHCGPFSGQKPIITQVHYESGGLQLADIVHLSSSYHGFLGTVPVGNSNSAVDVTLLPIGQTNLDASSLKSLKVLSRKDYHGRDLCQNAEDYLLGREVMKIGGITGDTTGKIEYMYLQGNMDPMNEDTSNMGEMFGIADLGDTSFATHGDSGSLVIIKLPNRHSVDTVYALGIISKIDEDGVVYCVRMEDCLKALDSVDICNERIKSSEMEIYTGYLKPLACVYNRRRPHVELPH